MYTICVQNLGCLNDCSVSVSLGIFALHRPVVKTNGCLISSSVGAFCSGMKSPAQHVQLIATSS